MSREYITRTYPNTKLDIQTSFGVNFITNIFLVDYAIHDLAVMSEWVQDFSKKLPNKVKQNLELLRTVFAHGAILREFYMMKASENHSDWNEFINWWRDLTLDEITKLITYGIQENLNYYYENLAPIPKVEKRLKGLNRSKLNIEEEDTNTNNTALKAVLESWSVEDVEKHIVFFKNPKLIQEKCIELFEGSWNNGFEEFWNKSKELITNLDSTDISRKFKKNEDAIYSITNLFPDTTDISMINRAQKIIFIPTLNLERSLSLFNENNTLYVLFEPLETLSEIKTRSNHNQKSENKILVDAYPAFEGLGDKTRLQILLLLSQNRELFAQQIVKALSMNQSMVSRHLRQLQESNLISIRQEGNTKFYSINKTSLRKVMDFLNIIAK
ncbi:ArsR/SmtB family transcription factor [Chengkuizengella axinellae]|uniref:Metalloregulator ArsR/SmtB family transcription factor n=1 Tax=Chengkuizengella axinellae TaxID=3064388 RepID=A0ABT9J3R1_9BACL|nr:metalloregulator ArsR/SmtB family transcription factor [Chengkuizengella sp. 2205SS18-9]MDP5276265.1 metalloregulator ArsR/SmtB family transcription factor [Chengkuizengella sp. 2205SS18-9]